MVSTIELRSDKSATQAIAPCEQTPRQCNADSCRFYSVLYSECRYHEIRAQMRVDELVEQMGGRPC